MASRQHAAAVVDKDTLVARLEEQRAVARELDKRSHAAHMKAMKEVGKARRALLREYVALSDDKLARVSSYNIRDRFPSSPACPLSLEAQLDKTLAALRYDRRKTISLDAHDTAYKIMVLSLDAPANTVCNEEGN